MILAGDAAGSWAFGKRAVARLCIADLLCLLCFAFCCEDVDRDTLLADPELLELKFIIGIGSSQRD